MKSVSDWTIIIVKDEFAQSFTSLCGYSANFYYWNLASAKSFISIVATEGKFKYSGSSNKGL